MENNKIKKKVNWNNIIRRAVQILSFIIMPGLFVSTFSAIKAVYTSLLAGTFTFSSMAPQLLIIAAVIPATMVLGRVFCGFICSFGALGDFIWAISKKVQKARKKKFKISEKTDEVLKLTKYALLIIIVIFMWTLGAISINANWNPWNIFGMYTTLSGWSSLSGWLTIGGLLLVLIMVGSFFVERFFCRYICPLGAILALASKLRIIKIKKERTSCGSCRICTTKCSMGIDMYKYDQIDSGECISCFNCVSPCPQSNVKVVATGKDVAPLAAGVATSVLIGGLYFAGQAATSDTAYAAAQTSSTDSTTVTMSSVIEDEGDYTDGVYTGSARGYRGTTQVEVTVENGYITSIEVTSTGDDMEYFNRAESSVISDIISSQSTDVDTVSGATYSSEGIIDAVANALSGSESTSLGYAYGVDDEDSTDEEATEDTTTEDTTAEDTLAEETATEDDSEQTAVNESIADVADGVYTGTGSGFRGDTEVEVTVEDGEITDIEVVSYDDDRQYFERALNLIDDILSTQSVDEVDTVSGATFSSNSILEAVANALGLDFENNNDSLEGGHDHGGSGGGPGGH